MGKPSKQDEYNKNPFSEHSKKQSSEFSSINRNEFSSQKENKVFAKSAMNDTHTINEERSAGGRLHSEIRKVEIPKVSSHITTVASTSASVASAAHAVVAAVSVVSVVAVSTLVGIQTVTESKARVSFSRFVMSQDHLIYECNLLDFKEEEESPFSIKVENGAYSMSQELFPGPNEGVFEGLVPNEVYTISVLQERFAGKTIYEESFTFVEANSAEFFGVYIDPKVDWEDLSFSLVLSYEDKNEYLSDFVLEILAEEPLIFPLAKTYDTQTFSFQQGQIQPGEEYSYFVSYVDRGQNKKWDGGTISFEIEEPPVPEPPTFYGVDWDWKVFFPSGETTLTLDYFDEEDAFSDFVLNVSRTEEWDPISFPLEKSKEAQTISILELDVFDETEMFKATITYQESGEEKTFEVGENTFTNTAVTRFDSIDISNQFDYENRTFSLTLNYVDENERLDNFVLTLTDETGYSAQYELEKVETTQTFELGEGFKLDPNGFTLSYSLSYEDGWEADPIIVEGTIFLSDPTYQLKDGEITSFTFDHTISYTTGNFLVSLQYEDPDDRISNIVLHLIEASSETDYSFPLVKSEDEQTLTFQEFIAEKLMESEFTAKLTYQYDGVETVYGTPETFYFTDSGDSIPESFAIESPYYLSYDGYFYLKINGPTDASYSRLRLVIEDEDGNILTNESLDYGEEAIGRWMYVKAAYPGSSSADGGPSSEGSTSPGDGGPGVEFETTYYLSLYGTPRTDEPTGAEETFLIEKQNISFYDASDYPCITSIRLYSTELDEATGEMTFTPFYTELDDLDSFQLLFRFGDDDIQAVPVSLDYFSGHDQMVIISLSRMFAASEATYTQLIEKLRASSVDFGFSYTDPTGATQTVYDYEGLQFQIS